MQVIDEIIYAIFDVFARFWYWTTPLFWIGFGIHAWVIVAYWLWVRVPETPCWSRERFKPRPAWRAICWPGLFAYHLITITGYISFHTVKGFIWSLTVEPIRRRLEYEKDVERHPYVNTQNGITFDTLPEEAGSA